ncbi:hypothetical protein AQJ11_43245 [Streptomyces corchorusii]|uniref:Uncharacterized protein n=1 Tax=Streptomyces corchorusii TaxID=1903 RepID=A0A101PPM5_STRCK|nr:hypothetical protein AQJ11_43245 [Streptomyces corchorusii]
MWHAVNTYGEHYPELLEEIRSVCAGQVGSRRLRAVFLSAQQRMSAPARESRMPCSRAARRS